MSDILDIVDNDMLDSFSSAIRDRQIYALVQPVFKAEDSCDILYGHCLPALPMPDGTVRSGDDLYAISDILEERFNLDILMLNIILDEVKKDKRAVLGICVSINSILNDKFFSSLFDIENDKETTLKRIFLEVDYAYYVINISLLEERVSFLRENGIKIIISNFGCGLLYAGQILSSNVDAISVNIDLVLGITSAAGKKSLKSIVDFSLSICPIIIITNIQSTYDSELAIEIGAIYIQGDALSAVVPLKTRTHRYTLH